MRDLKSNCSSVEEIEGYCSKGLSSKRGSEIESHVRGCTFCADILEAFKETQQEESELTNEIVREIYVKHKYEEVSIPEDLVRQVKEQSAASSSRDFTVQLKNIGIEFARSFAYSLTTIFKYLLQPIPAIVTIAILGIAISSWLTEPRYYSLARIEETFSTNKGRGTEQTLEAALTKLQSQDYLGAIALLDSHLVRYPESYLARYYKGLSHLMNAQKAFFGFLFRSFDNDEVENAIASLNEALQRSGDNQYYQQDCHWYLGKAYLMQGDVIKAKASFQSILALTELGLERKDKARQIIAALNQQRN